MKAQYVLKTEKGFFIGFHDGQSSFSQDYSIACTYDEINRMMDAKRMLESEGHQVELVRLMMSNAGDLRQEI